MEIRKVEKVSKPEGLVTDNITREWLCIPKEKSLNLIRKRYIDFKSSYVILINFRSGTVFVRKGIRMLG